MRYPGGAGNGAGGGGVSRASHTSQPRDSLLMTLKGSKQGMQSDYAAAPNNNAGGAGNDHPEWAGLSAIQRKIMEFVSTDQSDEGMHVSAISRTVSGGKGELAV